MQPILTYPFIFARPLCHLDLVVNWVSDITDNCVKDLPFVIAIDQKLSGGTLVA